MIGKLLAGMLFEKLKLLAGMLLIFFNKFLHKLNIN